MMADKLCADPMGIGCTNPVFVRKSGKDKGKTLKYCIRCHNHPDMNKSRTPARRVLGNRRRRMKPDVQAQQVANRLRREGLIVGSDIGKPDIFSIARARNHICYLCGRYFPEEEWTWGRTGNRLTPEHVVPLSRAEEQFAYLLHAYWNLLPACRRPCQGWKLARLLSELPRLPAVPPTDPRLWVRLAPSELWRPGMVGEVPAAVLEMV